MNLRKAMQEHNIDAYMVVTDDFHGSEYVGDYFKSRAYVSGFTGSAGTVIVTQDIAGLWTDGRYFLQAKEQLEDSGFTLFKMGNKGVPTVEEFIEDHVKQGQTLGFDGRTVPAKEALEIEKILKENKAQMVYDKDLVHEIWTDAPLLSAEPLFLLEEKYAGESRDSKIARVRQVMQEKSADYFVLTSLDDIAWLLNVRGNDIAFNPVVLSYLRMSQDEIRFYVNEKVLKEEYKSKLAQSGVTFYPYNQIYEDMKAIQGGKKVLLDTSKLNYAILKNIPKDVTCINEACPTILMKAVKNQTEVENEKQAHIKDGVAVTKLIYWVKSNVGKIKMSELSIADKLEEFRSMGEHYKGQSFDPISAYAQHGAIVHYSPSEESNKEVLPESFLLLDTGGQYLEGTTDITRTIALGEVTDEMKNHYTSVLKGNLNLASAKFKKGCQGINFDYLAREALWEQGLDYNHGTGHGVGYFLNVHEAPNGFRYKQVPERNETAFLEEGMITSDEPGIYLEGKYGIRLENLIVCEKYKETEFGEFLQFNPLTLVPFDKDAIDTSIMSDREVERLNEYHAKVFDKISPFLTKDEQIWLKDATNKLEK